MSSNKPAKTHFLPRPSSKYTKCGRPRTMNVPMSDDMEEVTCSQCIEPNKPFTMSPRDR